MAYRYNVFTGEYDYFMENSSSGVDFINQVDTDSGSAFPVANILDIVGDATQGTSTTGAGNTVTITVDDATTTQKGVAETSTDAESITGTSTSVTVTPASLSAKLGSQLTNSMAYGLGTTAALGWTAALTDGQIVIGATAGIPAAANITSTGATVVITNGTNSINLESGAAVPTSFLCDNAASAVPALGVLTVTGEITVAGTSPLVTSAAGSTVTINAQISQALASADATKVGLCNFDSNVFAVDADGFTTINTDAFTTAVSGWNGSIIETTDVVVTSDGATITLSVEQDGGGDLTVVFSDGFYDWDTTPADTVTLTAGTDTSPQLNYIYFLQSTKTLTTSTSGWPTTEYAAIATVLCQSAASLQTEGAYKVHVWTDHVIGTNDIGHIPHLNYWIRQQAATWVSGVAQSYNITTNVGTPDNVNIDTTSGSVLQLHPHTFPAFTTVHDYYVVNDNATPYNVVTDLNALLTDSAGNSMSGKYFSLVLWGSVSEDAGDCKLFINLPGGSYSNATSLSTDPDKYANYTIPAAFTGTGFLISQWDLRHQASSGGTWTSLSEIDLRGLFPAISAGGTTAFPNEFDDSVFRIYDDGDNTKKIAFQASPITTATTRTITAANYDIDLATVCISAPTDAGTATPAAGVLSVLGTGLVDTAGATSVVTINVDSPVVVSNGGTGLTATTAYAVLCGGTTSTAALQSIASVGTAAQVLTSNGAGALPTFQAAAAGALTWNVETGTSVTMVANNGYIANNAGTVTATLPASAAVGDTFRITGLQGTWVVAQNAGDTAHFGNQSTTTGAGGSLTSTDPRDAIEIICVVANTDFQVISSIGNITVT